MLAFDHHGNTCRIEPHGTPALSDARTCILFSALKTLLPRFLLLALASFSLARAATNLAGASITNGTQP